MPLDPKLQTDLDALHTAEQQLAADLGETPPAPAVVIPGRWRPTDAQTAAFATRIGWPLADLNGDRQANTMPATPKIPACDGTVADAMLYAFFGFDPSGVRVNYRAADRAVSGLLADRIATAGSAAAAQAILQGAGDPGVTSDLDCVLIELGQVIGGGLGGSPHVNAEQFQTADAWLAWWMSQTPAGPAAPGPGIA
jgi:hypothetical protein